MWGNPSHHVTLITALELDFPAVTQVADAGASTETGMIKRPGFGFWLCRSVISLLSVTPTCKRGLTVYFYLL